MQYLVPRFILNKYAEGEYSGQFEAVSLFVDVSGFSTVTTTLMQHGNEAAEAMSDIMDTLFEPLVSAIYVYGGFITTFAGDAFTALFPTDNLQTKNTYLQALAAALTIQNYLRESPTQETPYGNFPFSVKLGIACGQVGWGILTPDENTTIKSAYYFNGGAVDEAARAEHYAESGNLIVTAMANEILGESIQTIAAGEDGHRRVIAVSESLPEPSELPNFPDIAQEHFIPSAILERKTRGEFRQVVSVFVNLMGIDTARQLADFVRSVFSLQEQYGGYLGRVDFGDKGCNLLLFWGMPTSHENDISRALNFLLDLPNITPSTFKAGVTYQTVFACFAGSSFRSEFTTYGGGIALAARLMVKAPWGEVWMNEALQERAQRYFELQKVGEYPFKGFTEPQPVYNLIDTKQQALEEFFQGKMVGRDTELQQIRDTIDPILQMLDGGESQFAGVCVVAGEAGLGKSRLVYEFRQKLETELAEKGQAVKWLFGYTNQLIQEPLSPFRYALMNEFGQVPTASEMHNKRAFSRRMDEIIALVPPEYGRELNRLRSFIGSLLDLYWENSLYATADPEARQEMLFTALKSMMQGMSLVQPTIIITEDLHWIDPETRTFAERLFRNMDGFPIAMVGTVRLAELEANFEFPDIPFTLINLEQLSEESVEALAASILGNSISRDILNLVMERSEGNPFFAEQILLYLQQQNEIELRNGVWFLTNTTQRGSLPGDLRAIFVARLDQLTQEVKGVVQAASILGREFEVDILASMLKDEPQLTEKVLEAEQETVWSALSQVRYLFKHALLRDAAYSMQLRARRRVLHQVAAETLETVHASQLANYYRDIAYHYEAAYLQGIPEVADKAFAYLWKIGEQSLANYQQEIAADYFSRCLEITPALDNAKRYDALLKRSGAYFDIQKWNLAEADLTELAALAEQSQIPRQKAETSLKQAQLAYMRSQRNEAIEHAEHAIKLAQSAQAIDIEALAHAQLAEVYATFSDMDKNAQRYHIDQALNLARAIGDRDTEAEALIRLSHFMLGENLDQSLYMQYRQEALDIFRETGNRRKEAVTLYSIADFMDSHEESRQLTQHALSIAEEIGDRMLEARGLSRLAKFAFDAHHHAEALQYYLRALNLYREISYQPSEVHTLFNLGNFFRQLGELTKAREYYDEGLKKAQQSNVLNIGEFSYLAAFHFELGDYDKTQYYVEQMLAKAEESQSPTLQYMTSGEAVLYSQIFENYPVARTHYDKVIELEPNIDASENSFGEDVSAVIQSYLLGFLMHEDKHNEALIRAERIWSTLHGKYWSEVRANHNVGMNFYYELYRVWEANGDRRAYLCLEEGYESLQFIAERLENDEQRRQFFENVYYNRKVVEAYHKFKGIEPEVLDDVTDPEISQQPPMVEDEIIEHAEPEPDEIEVVVGEIADEPVRPQKETFSVQADDETPVVIHIEADEPPIVKTMVVKENEDASLSDELVDETKPRPLIHVHITIENHGTIHNFNIYNGDNA